MAPALDGMTYVARAVTPTGRPRRFNARFFVVDAEAISGDMADSHELLQLRWFSLPDARKLKIRSEEHTSELQSLMRISYADFCLKKKKQKSTTHEYKQTQ